MCVRHVSVWGIKVSQRSGVEEEADRQTLSELELEISGLSNLAAINIIPQRKIVRACFTADLLQELFSKPNSPVRA